MSSVIRQPGVTCETDEIIAGYVNDIPCMFIASSDSEQLANDISESDLTFIKCRAHGDVAFCVANNAYRDEDFIRLGIEWCRKHETKSVLITFPVRENVNRRKLAGIKAIVYNGKGQVKEKLEYGVPFMDTEVCFAKVFGKSIALDDKAELFETDLKPYATVNGRRMADERFKRKYPYFEMLPMRDFSSI